jgi:alpha-tubulin suppressor-like RCC1 family protein
VTTEYRAYCWGDNFAGQLGDGTITTRLKPVPVLGGVQFRQLSLGYRFTCGVSYPGNRAYCWGSNKTGQLGDGTTTQRMKPVAVAGTLRFVQVSVGWNHACGVTPESLAYCWGFNADGELGDSTTAPRWTPTRVAGGHHFRQVDGGGFHTCGVTTGDRGFCWGANGSGQVGDGKASAIRLLPKAVAGGLSFRLVNAGAHFSCGLGTDDRLYCWGSNQSGTFGDGTTTSHRTPVPAAGSFRFRQVGAGLAHTCGRTLAAVAYCWGENFNGSLGDGTTTNRLVPRAVSGPM